MLAVLVTVERNVAIREVVFEAFARHIAIKTVGNFGPKFNEAGIVLPVGGSLTRCGETHGAGDVHLAMSSDVTVIGLGRETPFYFRVALIERRIDIFLICSGSLLLLFGLRSQTLHIYKAF